MENKCLVDASPISKDELTTPSSVEEATVVLEEYALTGQDQPPDQPPATRILGEEAGTLNTPYLYKGILRKSLGPLGKMCLASTRKD